MNPLILTAKMDPESQRFFDSLREEHFPKHRNFLKAHITLYHHLPSSDLSNIRHQLNVLKHIFPMQGETNSLMFLGKGVAYKITCFELEKVKSALDKSFEHYLIPQDRQKFMPHITIQNKVTPDIAKNLYEDLKVKFDRLPITIEGFQLWEYLGGPWKELEI